MPFAPSNSMYSAAGDIFSALFSNDRFERENTVRVGEKLMGVTRIFEIGEPLALVTHERRRRLLPASYGREMARRRPNGKVT